MEIQHIFLKGVGGFAKIVGVLKNGGTVNRRVYILQSIFLLPWKSALHERKNRHSAIYSIWKPTDKMTIVEHKEDGSVVKPSNLYLDRQICIKC